MIDPEVARLRRLRSDALLVREIARRFESSQSAESESLLDRCACASWRIARVISGRLRGHPYAEYQRDAGALSRLGNCLRAYCLFLTHPNRVEGLRVLEAHVNALSRQLDDAICVAWSSDFSEALSRAHVEIRTLGAALAEANRSTGAQGHPAVLSSRSERVVGDLGPDLEGDWPYLAL